MMGSREKEEQRRLLAGVDDADLSLEFSSEPDSSTSIADACQISDGASHHPAWSGSLISSIRHRFSKARRPHVRRRYSLYWFCNIVVCLLAIIGVLLAVCGAFFPSYTKPAARYDVLRRRARETRDQPGRVNPHNESVFIAASLYDPKGALVSGYWGRAVQDLVNLLGPDNVHVSIYEDNASEQSKSALASLGEALSCDSTLVAEALNTTELPHLLLPGGTHKLSRIAFLAEVRNRALRPLNDLESSVPSKRFDKLLYLNDVAFDPVDAANLLLSTNADESTGHTDYLAACAVDFINPFKFYDTFATRDAEGYGMGVPFFPWFTGAGDAMSRRDVLAQKDAVRVKSCWGGMVAFEARWFYQSTTLASKSGSAAKMQRPLRFRAGNEAFWESSECCLIHADLDALATTETGPTRHGIFMNPYIRVAYSPAVLRWLPFTRRFERLYSPVHTLVNAIAKRPGHNPRRLHQPDTMVTDRVWTWRDSADQEPKDGLDGAFQDVSRASLPGGFCGMRKASWINEHPSKGQSRWTSMRAPEDNGLIAA